jgi:protein SCO1/2
MTNGRSERRVALASMAALAGFAALPLAAQAGVLRPPGHDPFGRVEPALPAPSLPLLCDDAQQTDLRQILLARVTAVQLMFTGCSATCPLQGALFAEVARRLPGSTTRLLSISIDPLSDGAQALRAWLARFAATATTWRAAAPKPGDVDALLDFLRGRADGIDRHTTQVYLFDRQARLTFRTPELPPAGYVVDLLAAVARAG